MRISVTLITILSLVAIPGVASADRVTEAEEQIKKEEPPIAYEEIADSHFASYCEYSWVRYASRDVKWRVFSTRLAFRLAGIHRLYWNIARLDRVGRRDYTIDSGSYFRFTDGYTLTEMGVGFDIDYVHNFQARFEFAHMMARTWVGRFGVKTYLRPTDDILIFSPGLSYYFDYHYVRAEYNISITEGRGLAQWLTSRGNFFLTERAAIWVGAAVGERLYDMDPRVKDRPYGYILLCGIDIGVREEMRFKVGYSYSEERPSFRKNSVESMFSMRF